MNTIATEIKLDEAALRELEGAFRGELIQPGNSAFDEHRKVWNGSIDRSPALIGRCTGVADVIAAVRFAKDTGLPVAVRGGGHSFPGLSVCDGGRQAYGAESYERLQTLKRKYDPDNFFRLNQNIPPK